MTTTGASGRPSLRIAFISTRIAGHDGVSLEIEKWAEVLEAMGHECFYIAGECDRPSDVSEIIPEAHFTHPDVDHITQHCFSREVRSPQVGERVHELTQHLKRRIKAALDRFGVEVIIAENSLTIPMNIPLGLAVAETVAETGLGCIAHHHDFAWERERYFVNAAEDYLAAAFPPSMRHISHVVINSRAAREFSRRTGLSCRLIPNVMDFEHPPGPSDGYGDDLRAQLGLEDEDLLILQPTRLVQRKGIEHSIELIDRLADPRCKLVISHASGDEGGAYADRVRRYAELLDVPVLFADQWMATGRGIAADGRKLYTIEDAYQQCDFVTYPSTYEGFGNAFLEAIYFRKPVLCNRYAIYRTDIEPCGFNVILIDGFLTDEAVEEVRRTLADGQFRREMVEHNYAVASRYYSYRRVEEELRALLAQPTLLRSSVGG